MIKDLSYYMELSYRIEIIEDKEEGGYAFSYPELPGCITSADTIEKGLEMLRDAKESWLALCIEDNYPIPEPIDIDNYSGQFKLRIPKSLHRTLAYRSKQEGVSMNQLCVYLLAEGVSANSVNQSSECG